MLLHRLGFSILVILAAVSIYDDKAKAELQVDITQGKVEPMPIAIPDFHGTSSDAQEMGRQIAQVVAADLERSGLFRPIDPKAFIQDMGSLQNTPRYADWRVLNTQALVVGSVESLGSTLKVNVHLHDVYAENKMIGVSLSIDASQWRRIAHNIADRIYARITGEGGYFDTRIVYVSVGGKGKNQKKRLAIMDYDGANPRFLTGGESLVMSPRFSPSSHEIAYMDFGNKKPRVCLMQTQSTQKRVLGHFPGMTFAPRFSPDGASVVMSLTQKGITTLQKLDLRSGAVQALTRDPVIDTSPSYSPDGSKIVFNSDRGGSQQLYIMNADGSNIERISFGQGNYATPVWSPRGDWIAFTRITSGNFYIGVMKTDGSGERMLAQGYIVDSPTWAPNGRVLMFMKQGRSDSSGRGGQPRLYTVDITGYNEREVPTPGGAEQPAWSPLIP